MLDSRLTNLAEIMVRLKILELGRIVLEAKKRFSEIVPERDYRMKEIAEIRSVYRSILWYCGEKIYSHFPLMNPELRDRVEINPVFLPRTKEAAYTLWVRDLWYETEQTWNEHGRQLKNSAVIIWGDGKHDDEPKVISKKYPEPVKGHTLITEQRQLFEAFELDLREVTVFELDGEESEFYSQTGQFAVASDSLTRFPIGRDIQAAGRCFGAGEYTSCIFHLGRSTECVLKNLARRRGISLLNKYRQPKSWANFNSEIRGQIISGKIKDDMSRSSYSHAVNSSEKLRKLRNGVDHASVLGSKFYEDRDEVKLIWKETKNFIEFAAQTFPAKRVKP